MSLAQLVASSDSQSAAWEALRFFVYAANGANLITVTCCLWTISGVSEVPRNAQWMAINNENSWPYKHAAHKPLPDLKSIGNENQILIRFGLAQHYVWQLLGAGLWYLIGLFLTFAALFIWIWLSQSAAVAAAVTVVLAPGCIGIVAPLVAVGSGKL